MLEEWATAVSVREMLCVRCGIVHAPFNLQPPLMFCDIYCFIASFSGSHPYVRAHELFYANHLFSGVWSPFVVFVKDRRHIKLSGNRECFQSFNQRSVKVMNKLSSSNFNRSFVRVIWGLVYKMLHRNSPAFDPRSFLRYAYMWFRKTNLRAKNVRTPLLQIWNL